MNSDIEYPALTQNIQVKFKPEFVSTISKDKQQIDYILALTILLLCIFGVVMITSIGVPKSIELTKPDSILYPNCGADGVDCFYLLKNHAFRLFVGLSGFLVAMKIPYKFWKKTAIPFFGLMFFTMLGVLFMGKAFNTTAKSWIVIANSSVQPTEIAKLALIFYMAVWIERKGKDIKDFKNGFLTFCFVAGGIIFPVAAQPDLGSTMVFTLIAVTIYFLGGARFKHIGIGALATFMIVLLILPFNGYIKHRFTAFMGGACEVTEGGNTRDFCWQTEQANIAIASGGFFGRGLTQGVQKSYWLPQATDDFIFAASSEELGFSRIILIVLAFGVIAYRGFAISRYAPDRFGMYAAAGITTWIVGQAYINIGVNIGVIPVTGITLPFISYGGTSLVSTLVGAGVLLNISKYTDLDYAYNLNRRRDSGTRYAKHSTYKRT